MCSLGGRSRPADVAGPNGRAADAAHPREAVPRTTFENIVSNVGSGTLVLVLNLVLLPPMIEAFGLELYGVLSLTWMVLGYLGWLDLGLSSAVALFTARALALGDVSRLTSRLWSVFAVQVVAGGTATVLVWLFAPAIAAGLGVSTSAAAAVAWMLRLFSASIPIELVSRTLNGVLEGASRFDRSNRILVLSTAATFAAYLCGIARGGDLTTTAYALLGVRLVNLMLLAAAARAVLRQHGTAPDRHSPVGDPVRDVGELLRFGGWSTVAAAIGPWLLYWDRIVISSSLGAAMLPFYAVPFGLLARSQVVSVGVGRAVFPVVGARFASRQWDELQAVWAKTIRSLMPMAGLLAFAGVAWGPWVLSLWLGPDFASRSAPAVQWLALGFAAALFAPMAGNLLLGSGRADLLAKVYLVELPWNMIAMVWLTRRAGLAGAAVCFLARAVVETTVLSWFATRQVPAAWPKLWRGLLSTTLPVVLPLALATAVVRPQRMGFGPALGLSAVALCASAAAYAVCCLDRQARQRWLRRTRALVCRWRGSPA